MTNKLIAPMETYLTHLADRGRQRTADSTRQSLKQFLSWTEDQAKDPLLLNASNLADFQHWLVTKYRTPTGDLLAKTTCATRLAQIKAWYQWCHARGLVAVDPSKKLILSVPRSRVVVREYLTYQELTAVVQTQSKRVKDTIPGTHTHAEAVRNLAAVCIALATGRRIGGMTTLRVDDVDVIRSELRVSHEKGQIGRVLPVIEWATSVVDTYLQDARPLLTRGHQEPWLFLNATGDGPMSRDALRWMLEQLLERTRQENPDLTDLPNKTITWHSLRVTFATQLFSNGCDIRSINELLLHSRLSTTARYTPIPVEDLRHCFRTCHPRR